MGPPFGTVNNDGLHGTGSECMVSIWFGFLKVNVLEELLFVEGFIVTWALGRIGVSRVESGIECGVDLMLVDQVLVPVHIVI